MKCAKCNSEVSISDTDSKCPKCGNDLLQFGATAQGSSVSADGVINIGDVGMMKDSNITSTTNVSAPAVGGSQVINIVTGDKSERQMGKNKCPICGRVVKDDYFECRKCHKDFICVRHQDEISHLCTDCASTELKEPEILCPICGFVVRDNYFRCKKCEKTHICSKHYNDEHKVCEDCAKIIKTDNMRKAETQDRELHKRDSLKKDFPPAVTIHPIAKLWRSDNSSDWGKALNNYWAFLEEENPKALPIEIEMDNLHKKIDMIRSMDEQSWYDFLYYKYFPWKFTAPNRLATTRKLLEQNDKKKLYHIKERIFSFNKEDIIVGLELVSGATGGIKGLGPAGASGLLAVLFPEHFGTADQFVIKALMNIPDLSEYEQIKRMKPEQFTLKDAEVLILIMKKKSTELNSLLKSTEWTPRKIDMILWSFSR